MELSINKIHSNETDVLQKCSKCRKFLSKNQFIKPTNKKNRDCNTCDSCRQQSSVHYKKSLEKKSLVNVDNEEEEMLLPKEMAKKLYNNITIIGCDEYLENESAGIEFKCNITLDDVKDVKDSPQEISRKIANLIGDSDGYYYIYLNSYYPKKKVEQYTIQYRCSQCQNLSKKPRKHQDLDHQRDRGSIERFDCEGTLRITIDMMNNSAFVYLKHNILHQ